MGSWDYSNFKENEKNVYFLRETNHASDLIFRKLLDESYSMLERGVFDVFLSEGWFGEFRGEVNIEGVSKEEYFGKENLVKTYLESVKGKCDVSDLLFCRAEFSDFSYIVKGIDDEKLLQKSVDLLREFADCISSEDKLKNSVEWMDGFNSRLLNLIDLRSDAAVKNSLVYLREHDSVGVEFGDRHYERMLDGYLRNGIGVVSYFPGEGDTTIEDGLSHLENILRFNKK
jgi:hypothetical protein